MYIHVHVYMYPMHTVASASISHTPPFFPSSIRGTRDIHGYSHSPAEPSSGFVRIDWSLSLHGGRTQVTEECGWRDWYAQYYTYMCLYCWRPLPTCIELSCPVEISVALIIRSAIDIGQYRALSGLAYRYLVHVHEYTCMSVWVDALIFFSRMRNLIRSLVAE